MIKKILLLCMLLCFFGSIAAENRAYRVEDVPMVHLNNRTQYVSNPDAILSSSTVNTIDKILFELEQKTGIQTLVVAVRSIEGSDCFEFAYELGRKNGVGQKGKDNGLVILLVTEERCIQFATGYGLEGDLPDAVCKQIQVRYMNQPFSQGDWNRGMLAGIQAIQQQLEETGQATPGKHRQESSSDNTLLYLILCSCFILVPGLLWFNIRQRKRCPKCHNHTLQQLSARTVSQFNGIKTEEVVYRCSHCGHTLRKQRQHRDKDDSHHHGGNGGPFLGGPFWGGFGGGHRSGGGFDGGSFGGGDFGGGGAGSKF